jgi:hypothetical protein
MLILNVNADTDRILSADKTYTLSVRPFIFRPTVLHIIKTPYHLSDCFIMANKWNFQCRDKNLASLVVHRLTTRDL